MKGRGFRWWYWVLMLVAMLMVFGHGVVRHNAAVQSGIDPAVVGQWGPLVDSGMEAIHMHMLPTGKVLMYGYSADVHGHDTPRIWDPDTGSFTLVDTLKNIFCSGHTFLADGRLWVTGGHVTNAVGIPDTVLFDPFALTWTPGPNMNAGRWYPTNTTLPNGDVLVAEGSIDTQTSNDVSQVYNPQTNTLRSLTSAKTTQWKWYNFDFVAPDGRVFSAGPLATTGYLDTSGTGRWTFVNNTASGWFREEGTGVMYDEGKVLIAGGGIPPTSSAEVINLNQPAPSWRQVSPMNNSRRHPTTTLLPDGKVLVTGGSCGSQYDDQTCPVLPAEMWDPVLEKFDTMASMDAYRGYHSTALLLPDARVLVAGGDQGPRAQQIYSPPYLFKGARPTITSSPTNVVYGNAFFVGTPDGANIGAVNWIRLGSVTHAFNQNQRINRLTFTAATNGLNITAPSNPNLCPPGHYMLFILDRNGVPSVSRIIHIDGSGSVDTIPPAIGNVGSSVGPTNAVISWATNEPATSQVDYGPTMTYGSSTSLDPTLRTSHSQTLSSLNPSTTYHYRVKSNDAAGNPAVSGDFTFTTSSAGSGPQNVVWTSLVNVTASGNSLRKTAGCNGCDDAGAISTQSIASGDGYVEFTASETTTYRAAGLSNGSTGTSLSDIDFAIFLAPGSWASVREKGVWKVDTQYTAGSVFRVAVVGGRVQYSNNGAVFYTSTAQPTYPLLVDTSLWSLNATITNAIISNGGGPVDTTPPVISSVAASAITSSSATISWNTNKPADSQVEYGVTSAYGSATGLNSAQVMSHSLTLSGLTPLTVYHYRVKSKDAAGNPAVSGDVTFTTPAAGGSGAQNVVWTALVKVTASGNSLTKTAGCNGCDDAGAISTQTLASGDGYVEFTASETTTYRAAGWGNGNTDTGLTDIDFAIQLAPAGWASVREQGVWKTDIQYTAGTVFRVAVVGGRVQYSKNGVVFYTSVALPTYPLLVDTSLWSLKATITNAVVSGAQ
jgi:hypothetical protein